MTTKKLPPAAITEYDEGSGRLTEPERLRMLRGFDELVPRIPARDATEVDKELRSLRRSRTVGARRPGAS